MKPKIKILEEIKRPKKRPKIEIEENEWCVIITAIRNSIILVRLNGSKTVIVTPCVETLPAEMIRKTLKKKALKSVRAVVVDGEPDKLAEQINEKFLTLDY